MGTGVYFFEEDLGMAKYWASNRYNGRIPKVIRGEIEIPSEKVLDMSDDSSKKFFHAFRKKLIHEELIKRKRNVTINRRQDLDGIVYNAIAQVKDYSLIRAETYTYQDEERDLDIQASRVPNSTEICLRNLNFLVNKEIV